MKDIFLSDISVLARGETVGEERVLKITYPGINQYKLWLE